VKFWDKLFGHVDEEENNDLDMGSTSNPSPEEEHAELQKKKAELSKSIRTKTTKLQAYCEDTGPHPVIP
jgi:hypothetical protein